MDRTCDITTTRLRFRHRIRKKNISDYISRHPERERKLIESTVVPIAFTLEDIATAAKQDKFL